MSDDEMSAAEAAALISGLTVRAADAARALRSVVALHERVAGVWLAGAEAAREQAAEACDAMALFHHPTQRAVVAASLAARIRGLPPVATPSPPGRPPEAPQRPEAPPDGGTEHGGAGTPARGLQGAAAYVEAAGVCERMAQAHDRLAAAADEGAERRQREAAGVLRCAADRIRALAGGP